MSNSSKNFRQFRPKSNLDYEAMSIHSRLNIGVMRDLSMYKPRQLLDASIVQNYFDRTQPDYQQQRQLVQSAFSSKMSASEYACKLNQQERQISDFEKQVHQLQQQIVQNSQQSDNPTARPKSATYLSRSIGSAEICNRIYEQKLQKMQNQTTVLVYSNKINQLERKLDLATTELTAYKRAVAEKSYQILIEMKDKQIEELQTNIQQLVDKEHDYQTQINEFEKQITTNQANQSPSAQHPINQGLAHTHVCASGLRYGHKQSPEYTKLATELEKQIKYVEKFRSDEQMLKSDIQQLQAKIELQQLEIKQQKIDLMNKDEQIYQLSKASETDSLQTRTHQNLTLKLQSEKDVLVIETEQQKTQIANLLKQVQQLEHQNAALQQSTAENQKFAEIESGLQKTITEKEESIQKLNLQLQQEQDNHAQQLKQLQERMDQEYKKLEQQNEELTKTVQQTGATAQQAEFYKNQYDKVTEAVEKQDIGNNIISTINEVIEEIAPPEVVDDNIGQQDTVAVEEQTIVDAEQVVEEDIPIQDQPEIDEKALDSSNVVHLNVDISPKPDLATSNDNNEPQLENTDQIEIQKEDEAEEANNEVVENKLVEDTVQVELQAEENEVKIDMQPKDNSFDDSPVQEQLINENAQIQQNVEEKHEPEEQNPVEQNEEIKSERVEAIDIIAQETTDIEQNKVDILQKIDQLIENEQKPIESEAPEDKTELLNAVIHFDHEVVEEKQEDSIHDAQQDVIVDKQESVVEIDSQQNVEKEEVIQNEQQQEHISDKSQHEDAIEVEIQLQQGEELIKVDKQEDTVPNEDVEKQIVSPEAQPDLQEIDKDNKQNEYEQIADLQVEVNIENKSAESRLCLQPDNYSEEKPAEQLDIPTPAQQQVVEDFNALRQQHSVETLREDSLVLSQLQKSDKSLEDCQNANSLQLNDSIEIKQPESVDGDQNAIDVQNGDVVEKVETVQETQPDAQSVIDEQEQEIDANVVEDKPDDSEAVKPENEPAEDQIANNEGQMEDVVQDEQIEKSIHEEAPEEVKQVEKHEETEEIDENSENFAGQHMKIEESLQQEEYPDLTQQTVQQATTNDDTVQVIDAVEDSDEGFKGQTNNLGL